MAFDFDTACLIGATIILAPVVGLIVGSQDRADARPLADGATRVLFLLLLTSCARFVPGRAEDPAGGVGFVVFFATLIAAVRLGYLVSATRVPAPRPGSPGKGSEPDPWDDELA